MVAVSAPAEGELGHAVDTKPHEPVPRARRPLFDPRAGEFRDVPVYWRADLAPGARIAGPAVIAEDDTSTVVGAPFDATIDRFGYIELVRREI